MSDFFQNGVISTLSNLTHRPVADLEQALVGFARQRPLALLLPSLYSELLGPAMPGILSELTPVPYLNDIVIGLDQASVDEYRHAHSFFSALPQHHRILWNDGPRLRAIDQLLQARGLAPTELGKGRNVWYCLGYLLASGRAQAVALHDCDIVTYNREMLARLIYPVANPDLSYHFSKGFYSRVADGTINGRVCRMLVTPLIRALTMVFGTLDYLVYLDSYRYPLAGEFAMRMDLLKEIRIPSDWGLEIGVLSEVARSNSTNHLCQVEIADSYDHKHQKLSLNDDSGGLSKMSIDISKAIFRKLATNGVVFTEGTFRTIKATYYRVALDFIETYRGVAAFNGLTLDIHREEQAVELFANNIMTAGQSFLDNPTETPFIPCWNRVISAVPDILEQLHDAVEADHQEYS